MKNLLRLFQALLPMMLIFSSCQKETTAADTSKLPSTLALLTDHTWRYDSLYNNYGQSNQVLIYVYGGPSNLQDWSKEHVKFYQDGSFDNILSNGTLRTGPNTWSMNHDSTLLYTTGGGYTNTAQIIKLTSNKLIWFDPVAKSYGIEVPKY